MIVMIMTMKMKRKILMTRFHGKSESETKFALDTLKHFCMSILLADHFTLRVKLLTFRKSHNER